MLEKIIAQTLKYRSFVLLGVLVLIAFGVYSYLNLPIDAFPDVTNVQVEILSTAPGLSALEIERFLEQLGRVLWLEAFEKQTAPTNAIVRVFRMRRDKRAKRVIGPLVVSQPEQRLGALEGLRVQGQRHQRHGHSRHRHGGRHRQAPGREIPGDRRAPAGL